MRKLTSKLSQLLSTYKARREQEQKERRALEGYTAWHPEKGRVYYPPTQIPQNEYNNYCQ